MHFKIVPAQVFPYQHPYRCFRTQYRRQPDARITRSSESLLYPIVLAATGRDFECGCCERCCGFVAAPESRKCTGQCGSSHQSSQTTEDRADQNVMKENVKQINLGSLDFRGFAPSEVKVKVTGDAVIVCGRHSDHCNSVEVTKRHPLPPDVDRSHIVCHYKGGNLCLELTVPEKHGESKVKEDVCLEGKKAEHTTQHHKCNMTVGEANAEEETSYESTENLIGLFPVVYGVPDMKCKSNPKSDDESKEDESVTGGDEISEQLTTDPAPKETHRQTDDAEDEDNTFVVDVGDNSSCIVKSDAQRQIHAEENNFVEEQKNQDDTSDQKRLTDANEDSEVERLIDQAIQKMKMEDQEIMQKSLATDVTDETADFRVQVDLSHYNPEDIRVLFSDGHVIVEAEREIKGDNYRQTENFCRRIRIPETVDESTLKSFLSNERFMTILAWSKRGGHNEETFPMETDGVMVHS